MIKHIKLIYPEGDPVEADITDYINTYGELRLPRLEQGYWKESGVGVAEMTETRIFKVVLSEEINIDGSVSPESMNTNDDSARKPLDILYKFWKRFGTNEDERDWNRIHDFIVDHYKTDRGSYTKALHNSTGKPDLSLIPAWPLWVLATVYMYGTSKYAKDDWRAGHDYSEWYASCKRHLDLWWDGEENNSESGLPHLGHAMWCIATLMWQERYRKQFDNRPKLEDIDKDGAKYADIGKLLKDNIPKWMKSERK